jgi:uncharacterized membrane protein HdeD (DUF308 family)
MARMARMDERMLADDTGRAWWLLLGSGIAWMVIAVVVLRMDVTAIATVGLLVGAMFAFAAVNEFMMGAAVAGGWRFLHYLMGALFILGALWGFFRPIDTFFALASVVGLLLVLMGTFDIVRAIASRSQSDVWWLGLVSGLLLILLGIWASQRFFPARAELILLWTGFMAIFRGISLIAMSFGVRGAGKELAAA